MHNPAFAAFGSTEREQNLLAAHLKHLSEGGVGHGHAGLASFFADLAHRKTATGGTLALVLPLSSMSGASWEAVRRLWRAEYSSLIVATIADAGSFSRSFSADTGMAECLLVAKKVRLRNGERRAFFAILDQQPQSTLEGELIAQAISTAIAAGNIRTLENGPFGGTRIVLGETAVGEMIDCPLPTSGAWQMVGIRDISLGQTAHQLTSGRLWIEGMSAAMAVTIPVAPIGDVCERIGPHHLDITGAQIKGDGLPQVKWTLLLGPH